jgi:F-type H+-transporting ATPase subunit b
MMELGGHLLSMISHLADAVLLLGIADLGINGPSLIAYLINFVILLGILIIFAYKPLLRLLDQRSERIRESLEAADRAREDAATSREAIEEQLNEARREGQRLLEGAREAAERYRGEEMDRARQEAESFVERARSDIQRERDTAIQEVRANFGDLAITAAERVIRSSLDRQAHNELISQVLEEGEQASRRPRG